MHMYYPVVIALVQFTLCTTQQLLTTRTRIPANKEEQKGFVKQAEVVRTIITSI